MRKHILYFVYTSIACSLMMLMSACRTMREAANEERSAQTTQEAVSSADFSSSHDRFFSALSAYADSIIVWMVPEFAAGETGLQVPTSSTCEQINTEVYPDSMGSKPAPKPSGSASPRIGKIKISGLRFESAAYGERAATHQSTDSISHFSSRDSEKCESTKSTPKRGGIANLFALVGVLCSCGVALWFLLRRAHK